MIPILSLIMACTVGKWKPRIPFFCNLENVGKLSLINHQMKTWIIGELKYSKCFEESNSFPTYLMICHDQSFKIPKCGHERTILCSFFFLYYVPPTSYFPLPSGQWFEPHLLLSFLEVLCQCFSLFSSFSCNSPFPEWDSSSVVSFVIDSILLTKWDPSLSSAFHCTIWLPVKMCLLMIIIRVRFQILTNGNGFLWSNIITKACSNAFRWKKIWNFWKRIEGLLDLFISSCFYNLVFNGFKASGY